MAPKTTTPLAQIEAQANPDKASDMARYHKVDRPYLGVANPELDAPTLA